MKEKLEQIFDKHHYGFGEYNKDEIIKELLVLYNVVGQSEQLKAISDLKDFAYEVCPLHREDDLEEIVGRL